MDKDTMLFASISYASPNATTLSNNDGILLTPTNSLAFGFQRTYEYVYIYKIC